VAQVQTKSISGRSKKPNVIAGNHSMLKKNGLSFLLMARFCTPRNTMQFEDVAILGGHVVNLHRIASVADYFGL
jgi:hypothetical protein